MKPGITDRFKHRARFFYISSDYSEHRRSQDGFISYNAMTKKAYDMLKSGIIDPAKVTRSAVQNAASIAAMILTTEVLIAVIPEPTPNDRGMGDMGGMM